MRTSVTLPLLLALPACSIVYDVEGLAEGTASAVASGGSPGQGEQFVASEGTERVPATTAGQAAACTEAFGTLTDFLVCEETDNTCRFYAKLNDVSCTTYCEAAGWFCVGAEHNQDEGCSAKSNEDCDADDNSDAICICGR